MSSKDHGARRVSKETKKQGKEKKKMVTTSVIFNLGLPFTSEECASQYSSAPPELTLGV